MKDERIAQSNKHESLSMREQFREVFAICWKAVKLRPVLLLWPVTLYKRFFERDVLERWFNEAQSQ